MMSKKNEKRNNTKFKILKIKQNFVTIIEERARTYNGVDL